MYSRDRLIKAIDNSACLTRRQINDYLQKKLYPEELYVVEMHLIECPFCNDAIEGFATIDNANNYLSKVEEFNFGALPSVAKEQIVNDKKTTKKESLLAQVAAEKSVQKEVPQKVANKRKDIAEPVFEQPKKKFSWPISIAAAIVLGFSIWGLNALFFDKNEDSLLADASTDADSGEMSGMINESAVDRKEDSLMNAKFAFHNQDPLPSSATGTTIIRSGSGERGTETEGVSMAEEMVVAAAPTTSNAASAEKSTGFIGPVMPKDEEPKKPAAKATTASTTRVSETALAKNRVAETDKKKVETIAKKEEPKPIAKVEQKVARTQAAESVSAKKEEKKVEVEKVAKKADIVLSQAEKDFNKGMELYNKKQFAASIVYFQAAAKASDFAKRKQAESYVKLAKNEVVNAERKKNSGQTKDK